MGMSMGMGMGTYRHGIFCNPFELLADKLVSFQDRKGSILLLTWVGCTIQFGCAIQFGCCRLNHLTCVGCAIIPIQLNAAG